MIGFTALVQTAHAAVPTPGHNSTGQVWGRALMPDGATGIPGCEVQLLWKNNQVLAQTTSDADGNFYFTLLQPSEDTWNYKLVVKRGTWGMTTTQEFQVMADSATSVQVKIFPFIASMTVSASNLTLPADDVSRVTLTIDLRDINGIPVPDGMHVDFNQYSFYPNPGKFYAGNTNGTRLTLPTMGGKVMVQYGGVPGDTLSRNVQIIIEGNESLASKLLNLTFDLQNPNVIRGTVYDATGRPVPGAKVFLSRWDGAKFVGYSSAETGDRTDGSGVADASGNYRFAVMPAGDYRVNATESTYASSARVTVVRGTYDLDINILMERGSIRGWVKDNRGIAVPGATVSLLRFYGSDLIRKAVNTTLGDGSFSFDDIWYGKYDVRAVYGNQTAELPIVLEENRTTVNIALLYDVPVVTLSPTATPEPADATATPGVHPAVTATPKPPTPTPPPITIPYLASSYGIAIAVMVLIAAALFLIAMRIRR